MQYVIYEPATKAEIRYNQITEDAIDANFLSVGEQYTEIIYHPTEDRAALFVQDIKAIYYQGLPTQGYNYEIFFTLQEMARAVDNLPDDWYTNNSEI